MHRNGLTRLEWEQKNKMTGLVRCSIDQFFLDEPVRDFFFPEA